MIIVKEKLIESAFSHEIWEKIKQSQYSVIRFQSKDSGIMVSLDKPKVMGQRSINILNGKDRLSIDFNKVKNVSSFTPHGQYETIFQIDLIDGSVVYLDSAF